MSFPTGSSGIAYCSSISERRCSQNLHYNSGVRISDPGEPSEQEYQMQEFRNICSFITQLASFPPH